MQLDQYENHFAVNILPPPKPYWTAKKLSMEESLHNCCEEHTESDEFIESVLKDSSDLIESNNALNSSTNYDLENVKDPTCRDVDNWFNKLLKQQLHRKTQRSSF